MKSINIDDFSIMPVCIFKDTYSNHVRTPDIEINNIVRPNKKHMVNSVNQFEFSQYHYHEGIEILKIDKGTANVYINDNKYAATENDILIVNPFELHGIYLHDENAEFSRTCLVFQPMDLFPSEQKDKKIFFENLRNMRFVNFISHNENLNGELCRCVDNITQLSRQHGAHWPIAVFSNLIMFYSIIVRENYKKDESDCVPYQHELMAKVTDFIDANIHRDISTEEVASYCLYSVEHFCRLFKKCFNRTFKDYLNMCRIQKARELVDTGDFSVLSDVWKAAGFNNANHFTNTFKKYLGCSPSRYIKNNSRK